MFRLRMLVIPVMFFSFVNINLAIADPQLGTWTQGSPAPGERTEIAATALDGKIYAIGGFNRPSLNNLLDFAISQDVEVYDPVTDSWSVTTPLPEGRHHAGIAALNGFLYIIGGFTQSGFSVWHAVNTVYQYNPSTQSWHERAPMPTARGALGVAVYGDRLYAIGGYDGEQNSGATEVYDPKTDTWSAAAPLPAPRDHLAVAAAGTKIFAMGGRSNLKYRQNTSVVEAYDPATNQWQTRANLPTARSGISAGVIDGQIYVLGGESGTGTFDNNEKYSPDEDRWTTMNPMPTARHGLGIAVVNGQLYAISGGPEPGASFSRINEIFTPPPH